MRQDCVLVFEMCIRDRERRTPVTLPADCPINHVFQEVPHASVPDILRVPRDCIIVAKQGVLHCSRPNEPRSPGIIEERCIASPTERIRVAVLLAPVKASAVHQMFYDQRIGFLDMHALPIRYFLSEPSFLIHQLDHRQVMI